MAVTTESIGMMSTSPDMLIERAQLFVRWQRHRLDDLDVEHEPVANPIGWLRKGEFWIKASVWLNEAFRDDRDAIDAAKALRDLGLLRTPKTEDTLQVPINPRGVVQRCYVLRKAFEEWEPPPRYARPAGPTLIPIGSSQSPTALSPSSEPALSDLLSQGTALALQRGIELLSVSPNPFDRSHAQLLKTQSAYAVHFLNTKLRVDEGTLRSQRDEFIANILEGIKEANAIAKELDAQGGPVLNKQHDGGQRDGHDNGRRDELGEEHKGPCLG